MKYKLKDNTKKLLTEKILRSENTELELKTFEDWKNFQITVKGYQSPIIKQENIDIDESDDWIVLNDLNNIPTSSKESLSDEDSKDKRKTMVIDCSICFDEVSSKDIYIMDECDHKFCRDVRIFK